MSRLDAVVPQLLALSALCLAVPTVAIATEAAGSIDRTGTPVFAVFQGDLAPGDEVALSFGVAQNDYAGNEKGEVLLGFLLESPPGSAIDPGLVQARSVAGPPANFSEVHHLDTPGSSASFTLARLATGGHYAISVRPEHGTAGPYELAAFLAGDVNGDFQVDTADLALIRGLAGTKAGVPAYNAWADVDRNGVINGGDLQRATRNLGAATSLRLVQPNPLDQFLPSDALALTGVDPRGFNSISSPLVYTLSGAEFYSDPKEVKLTINGHAVPASRITIDPHHVSVAAGQAPLVFGRNTIRFAGVDDAGRPLYHTTTIWAGMRSLTISVVDENDVPVTEAATVRASLSDDPSVLAEATTSTGQLVFTSVPDRTILVKATASGNRLGVIGVAPNQFFAKVRLIGFNPPSPIDNNDFHLGTAGWSTGTAPVHIAQHIEGFPPHLAVADLAAQGRQRGEAPPMSPAAGTGAGDRPAPASIVDQDLTLGTAGEGLQSISRTFPTDPDVTAVRIRYRFITSEVPGGWFGSQYNDYFSVSLRSQQAGTLAVETNSMNGLGLPAFDFGSGATAWRDVTLKVDKAGDVIQVDIGVANVGDGLFDSQVVIDFVEEVREQIQPSLSWNSTQGGMDLRYTVQNGPLAEGDIIYVYWASGPASTNRIGAAIHTENVPQGTAEGAHGPIHIAGQLLQVAPAGVTHLIAVTSPTHVGALADVQVAFGPQANAATVGANVLNIVKGALRVAGQPSATIFSTARTPADQARAMFNNLVNPAHSVATNIANQLGIYGPPGDAVINVFVQMTQGLTLPQIMQQQGAIRAAMEQEINNQGPTNVSHHCADPTQITVIDVGAGAFNASNGPLFVAAVSPNTTNFIDERATNNCYHLEF